MQFDAADPAVLASAPEVHIETTAADGTVHRDVPAADETSIDRTSAGFERKFAGDPAAPAMVRTAILSTILRLEPA